MGDGMVAGMEATQISFSNQNKAEPMAPEMMNRAGSGTVVRNRSAIVLLFRLKTTAQDIAIDPLQNSSGIMESRQRNDCITGSIQLKQIAEELD